MKKHFSFLALLTLGVFFLGSCEKSQPWEMLFNGEDLSNWDLHLGTSLGPDFQELANAAIPEKVFSVVEMNGENLIRISGEINGALATKEVFENYHLQLVYRWGKTVYTRRNSGLLYHSFGDFGPGLGTWMANIEFQMLHENTGDTYLMANTACDVEVTLNPETNRYVFTPGSESITFGEHAYGRLIRKRSDHENPLGDWNTLDLYTVGRTAVHVVNGETVMINTNTGTYEDGRVIPLTGGKIQIQSEGATLYIKTVKIRPISDIPAVVLL
jgi:hypothetical protein